MPKVLAYRTLDQSGSVDVVIANLTEDNAPPLLVLWLHFTTNPTLLDSISTDAQFAAIGGKLGLSATCVKSVFGEARNNRQDFTNVANRFQNLAAAIRYTGPAGNCILSDTILKLAPAAKAAVTPPVPVPPV